MALLFIKSGCALQTAGEFVGEKRVLKAVVLPEMTAGEASLEGRVGKKIRK